jgi:hypothetical protein
MMSLVIAALALASAAAALRQIRSDPRWTGRLVARQLLAIGAHVGFTVLASLAIARAANGLGGAWPLALVGALLLWIAASTWFLARRLAPSRRRPRESPENRAREPKLSASIVVLTAAGVLAASAVAAPQAPAGWLTFRDGLVEVSHPRGWQVQRDRESGRLLVQGSRGERLLVWPFFVDGTLDAGTAGRMLAGMAGKLAPQASFRQARSAGPHAVRADGRAGADAAATVLAWTTTPRGTAVQFVFASSPPELRRSSEAAFADILGSVRLTGRPRLTESNSASSGPGIAFVRFQDPSENAFSIDVPRGWHVNGGLTRRASVDVRLQVLVSSPDNQVHLRIGDADLPPFTIPTPMLGSAGFHEGSWYSPGYGVRMQVLRYLGGEQFAQYWVNTRLGASCPGAQIVDVQPLPQTVRAINAIMARNGSGYVSQRVHAGDVAFRCQQGPAPMAGYLFVATILAATPDGAGIWSVDQLQGYLTAVARTDQAQAILAHMMQSLRLNPDWVRMQQNITGKVSGIVTETGHHISKVITDGYWGRQAIRAEGDRRRSNQILGVEDVRDPVTGRELKVESGANYYWIDQRGNVVGTTSDSRPNLDFRELIRLP